MKTVCESKSPKFKNLTIHRDYEAEKSDDNFIIINDAGIKAKYNKKYFRIVPQSILDTATIGIDIALIDDNEIGINVEHLGRGVSAIDITLRVERASNSCGIIEIDNISNLKYECDRVSSTPAISMELFKRIIIQLIHDIKEQCQGAFITFSTNVDVDALLYYSGAFLEMHKLTDLSFIRRNTNSGNTIALWVIPMNDETL